VPNGLDGGGKQAGAVARSSDDRGTLAEGWLPLVLPATANRIHCHDRAIGARLSAAGASTADLDPEVEIGDVTELRASAGCVVTPIDLGVNAEHRRGSSLRRASRAMRTHLRLRWGVWRARRLLHRRGYGAITVFRWDKGRGVQLASPTRRLRPRAAQLPQRALLVASRHARLPSVLDAALEEASQAAGTALVTERVLVRTGVLVVVTPDHVLRLTTTGGPRSIGRQAETLARLQRSRLGPASRRLLPVPVGTGLVGLTRWAVETRVPGRPVGRDVPLQVLDDALAFLDDLFSCGADVEEVAGPVDDAAAISGWLIDAADRLAALALRSADRLTDLPRGVAHGDLYPGNLLASKGALSGVIDWDGAVAGAPPLIDLLHLLLTTNARRGSLWWGPGITQFLLPTVRRGGDDLLRSASHRAGFDPTSEHLEALVAAYWLGRLRYQLETYRNRLERPTWMERNVHDVLRALEP
jgi:hypothetical protein